MSKTIAILGTGGHGWQVFTNLIKDTSYTINMFGLTVDYGGSGGLWYRLQEINNFELTKNIFHEAKPVLPWGDFNKIIQHFMAYKFSPEVARCLDFRSENLNSHLHNFHILSDYLALTPEIHNGFEEFFLYSFKFYQKYKDKLGYTTKKKFCFGYPWQDFVFWNLGRVDDLNTFYKNHKILPNNLNLYFTAKEREVLVGSSENRQYLGEDQVDNSQEPILPESLEIFTTEQEKVIPDQLFLQRLERSEMVIFPTGSITNWLPLVSVSGVLELLQKYSKEGSLYWVLNLEKALNEVSISEYLRFLKKQKLKPKLILPRDFETYKEQKNFHNFTNLDLEFELIPALEVDVNKYYKPASITKVLKNL